MSVVKCRFVERVGTVYHFSVYSSEVCGDGGYHRTDFPITEAEYKDFDGVKEQHAGKEAICEGCGQAFTPSNYSGGGSPIWNTEDGELHPGDMWYASYLVSEKDGVRKSFHWDNETDPCGHLHIVLPNGRTWDIDSRASNCTMKEDRMHRCWVRHGEPPHITVDKNGHTCSAGAGSIGSGEGANYYHAMLQEGELRQC